MRNNRSSFKDIHQTNKLTFVKFVFSGQLILLDHKKLGQLLRTVRRILVQAHRFK